MIYFSFNFLFSVMWLPSVVGSSSQMFRKSMLFFQEMLSFGQNGSLSGINREGTTTSISKVFIVFCGGWLDRGLGRLCGSFSVQDKIELSIQSLCYVCIIRIHLSKFPCSTALYSCQMQWNTIKCRLQWHSCFQGFLELFITAIVSNYVN